MDSEKIERMIEKKIEHYRKIHRLLDNKDAFSAGALEALICLQVEIEEEKER